MCGAEQGPRSVDLAKNGSFFDLIDQIWLLRRFFWLIPTTEVCIELPALNWNTTQTAGRTIPILSRASKITVTFVTSVADNDHRGRIQQEVAFPAGPQVIGPGFP